MRTTNKKANAEAKRDTRSGSGDGIFTRKDRPGAFYITWIDAQGKRRKRRTDARNLRQAGQSRRAELVEVERAKALGFTPPGRESFAEIADRFVAYQRARLTPRAFERESGIIENHLKEFFAGRRMASIRRVDVGAYVTARGGRVDVSAHSVQKELNVLKHLLRLAVEWEVIPINPALGIRSPRVPAGRVRYLQPAELELVLGACPRWLVPVVVLAVSTGMRRSEILGLRPFDVDLGVSRLMLPVTKNGERRIVYLNGSARDALADVVAAFKGTADDRRLLFPDLTPDQVSIAFRRVLRKVGINDFRFHDLRHTAASWLRMSGADIHTVATVLGHRDLRMAMRYAHLSPDHLATAVARLDDVLQLSANSENLRPHGVPASETIEADPTVTH